MGKCTFLCWPYLEGARGGDEGTADEGPRAFDGLRILGINRSAFSKSVLPRSARSH